MGGVGSGRRPQKANLYCTVCGIKKTFENTWVDSRLPNSLATKCKECFIEKYGNNRRGESNRNRHKEYFVRVCRNCGDPIGLRGNYFDWCKKCLPTPFTPIGFCSCGVVFKRKGRQKYCNACIEKRRIPTARENGKKRSAILRAYKNKLQSGGCIVCGYNKCISALEFHHINQKKEGEFNKLHSILRVRQEIEKSEVIVLCANCHREVHAGLIDDTKLKNKKLSVGLRQAKLF